ncbi:SPOR domain-containing protein [Flaviramulus sp. BrNp1-15]|uniref:SPOR domain-containing protein n=1 Tax=Flaviramulus sp. BrNp1-15 TaxID=2916754 RepID=UPI001EE850A4|nr:SPOR domain-containing protein [Flaviramulus sp. BrNp1-15]ULC59430.1 SPOR domain-containing protein [Flaviramulus sp. BrNp1-15]
MKPLNLKIRVLSVFCFVLSTVYSFAQQGSVTVNQDKKIDALLELKKEMNKNENDSERYKIQVYSGNRSGAQNAQKEFGESFGNWHPSMQYETPNFKIWAGSFRTRLEADRALKRIKRKFPHAFIFKPKK